MLIATIILATLLVAMVILLALEDRKSDRLLAEKAVLQKQADDLRDVITAVHKDDEAREKAEESDEPSVDCQKPLTVESIRTALRFNGYSPGTPDPDAPEDVIFKKDEFNIRIMTARLPFVSIISGCPLDKIEASLSLLQKAAEEVTKRMYIGKVFLTDDEELVLFSVEFLSDSYVQFRDRLNDYLQIVTDTGVHFFDAVKRLEMDAKKERESVFSGESFLQAAQANSKKIQS